MSTEQPHTPSDHRGHAAGPAPVAMWLGLLVAPAAFFVHLEVAYLLVTWVCFQRQSAIWVHVAGALAIVVAALGLWAARIAWLRAGGNEPGEAPTLSARTRLLGAAGVGVSSVLLLILLAQWVAGFIVPMCQ